MYASGELLAQLRPSGTTAVTLLTADQLRIEVTLLVSAAIAGTSGVDVEIYHDDDGTTYNNDTLIYKSSRTAGGSNFLFWSQAPGGGIIIKPGGSLGVKIDSANAINFSVYGITEQLAGRVRGLNNG